MVPGLDPERFCAVVAERSADAIGLTPVMATRVLDADCLSRHDLSSVGHVVVAPAPVRPDLGDRLKAALPGAAIIIITAPPAGHETKPPRAESRAPMTFTEEMLVWQEQFLPGCYNLPPFARTLRGKLDLDALQEALTEVFHRHQALRTNFAVAGGRAVQVVRPPGPVPLPVVDVSDRDPEARQAELARVVGEATNRPVDLVQGSLFEPVVIRFAPEEHLLVIPMHHCVWDAWSMGVFHRELSALYGDIVAGRPPSLAPPAWQMGEFSSWQHQLLAGDEGTTQRSFWQEELAGAPLTLQLPIADPDLPAGTPHTAARPVSMVLSPALTAGLRAVARAQRSTPFMAMLAAFAALVHRCTGQDDLMLTSVTANRNRTEVEGTIGCVAKRIPLRVRVGGDPTFAELITRAREVLLGALTNQDVPDEVLQSELLGPPAARHGLVPHLTVMFQGLTAPRARLDMAGLEVENFDPTTITPKRVHVGGGGGGDDGAVAWGAGMYNGTSLALFVSEGDDGTTCLARGVFHRPAVETLLGWLRTLVTDAVADPHRRVSKLRLLDDDEVAALMPEGRGEGGPDSDRLDLRGFRVRPRRLEATLAGCPGIREVAVAIRDDELVAYAVPDCEGEGAGDADGGPGAPGAPAPAGPPDLNVLRRFLWSRLPGHAWPAHLVLVEHLPRLADGRLDASAVAGTKESSQAPGAGEPSAWLQSGEHSRSGQGCRATLPAEVVLADLWAEALGGESLRPGRDYRQSFAFVDAVAAARQAGIDVPSRKVMKHRTVETLSAALAAQPVPPPPAPPPPPPQSPSVTREDR